MLLIHSGLTRRQNKLICEKFNCQRNEFAIHRFEEYAVLLDCIQNGSPIRILLLAKVEGGKIAEMTYITLKQEY